MFQQLDPQRILETSLGLEQRILARFPGSGLSGIARELSDVARAAQQFESWLARPLYTVRTAVWMSVGALITIVALTLSRNRIDFTGIGFSELVQGVEAFINDLIFVGIAIYFLLGLERRIKRARALKQLHVLRSMAHIIDLHQLTKDPESIADPANPGPLLTPLQMARYLDYSSELLAVSSKIAALYVQHFDDAETLAAASDIEALTVSLSQKIWQKINILNRVTAPQGGPG